MKFGKHVFAAIALLLVLPSLASAQRPAPEPQLLTLEMAKAIAVAAEAESERNGWRMTVLIVDAQGIPLYLTRATGAMVASHNFATGKVRSVLGSGLSTKDYAEGVRAGTVQPVPDGVALEGGFPIMVDGKLAGAIAVSGARPEQDAQAALAGLAALGTP
jgi:glc operon protein GlcG